MLLLTEFWRGESLFFLISFNIFSCNSNFVLCHIQLTLTFHPCLLLHLISFKLLFSIFVWKNCLKICSYSWSLLEATIKHSSSTIIFNYHDIHFPEQSIEKIIFKGFFALYVDRSHIFMNHGSKSICDILWTI